MKRLFRDLKDRQANPLDNGMVSGNVSLADQAAFKSIDKKEEK